MKTIARPFFLDSDPANRRLNRFMVCLGLLDYAARGGEPSLSLASSGDCNLVRAGCVALALGPRLPENEAAVAGTALVWRMSRRQPRRGDPALDGRGKEPMQAIALLGSPRKVGNNSIVLDEAIRGVGEK